MAVSSKKKRLIFNDSFESSLDGRAGALSSVKYALEQNGIQPSITHDELLLIVDEAVMNAMEHGNKWNEDRSVSVSLSIDSRHLDVAIEDQGDGFDFKTHLSDFAKGNKLSSRGRGLSIIRRFCIPSWDNSGKCIILHVPVS